MRGGPSASWTCKRSGIIPPWIFQIFLILAVALFLLRWFVGDSNVQGEEVKGVNKYRQTSTTSHRWSSRCRPFLSPCPPPPNPSTFPTLLFPTAHIVSIVTPYPHSPWCNQILPSPNPTQSPLLFYGRCSSQNLFFSLKKSLANREHLWRPSMLYIAPELSRGCFPFINNSYTCLRLHVQFNATLRSYQQWELVLEIDPQYRRGQVDQFFRCTIIFYPDNYWMDKNE